MREYDIELQFNHKTKEINISADNNGHALLSALNSLSEDEKLNIISAGILKEKDTLREKKIFYKSQQAQMIFLALLYVLRHEGIEFDYKYDFLGDQLTTFNHDAVHLADLLEELHEFIELTGEFDRMDEEDDEDEEI